MYERAEGHPQIVMRPAVEVHLVAGFQPQAEEPDVAFQSAARVENRADVVGSQAVHRTEEVPQRGRPRIKSCVDKTALQDHERMKGAGAGLKLGPEKPMEQPQVRAR